MFRRAEEEGWNLEFVTRTIATPTKHDLVNRGGPLAILCGELEDGEKSGRNIFDTPTHQSRVMKRDFKLTRRLVEEHGYIIGLAGGEAAQA